MRYEVCTTHIHARACRSVPNARVPIKHNHVLKNVEEIGGISPGSVEASTVHVEKNNALFFPGLGACFTFHLAGSEAAERRTNLA